MRRLIVYLLIDTSGSMKGEPIESVKVGLEALFATLRLDPFALESVYFSIITFDKDVKNILPVTSIENVVVPDIVTPDSGPTHTGAALMELCRLYDQDVMLGSSTQKGDWKPLAFIMTDGKPSDLMLYKKAIEEVKKRKFSSIVGCAAGMKAKVDYLKLLTDDVHVLDQMDSRGFLKLFKWVSASIGVSKPSKNSSENEDVIILPEPPDEINNII